MAEGGGLLNRYTAITRIVGSNPIPSATSRASCASQNLTLLSGAPQGAYRPAQALTQPARDSTEILCDEQDN